MLALARRSPPCASVPPEQARDANRVAGGVKGGGGAQGLYAGPAPG